MNNVALFLLGGLLIAGLAWVFAQWYATRRLARGRQHLEDALKHLFDLEYRGKRGISAISLAMVHPITSPFYPHEHLTVRNYNA